MPTRRDWHCVLGDGTTTYGFMRAKGKQYRDAPVLPPRVMTSEEASDAQYPTQFQQVITQTDWRGGLGGVQQSDYKDSKYADGLRVDASSEALVKLARALVDTSYSVAAAASTKGVAGMGILGDDLWLFRDTTAPVTVGFKWNFTNRNWVNTANIHGTAQRVVPNGVPFNGNLYFPLWGLSDNTTATAYRFIAEGAAGFTTSTLTPNDFYFFAASADGRFWGAYRPTAGQRHHVYTATDPTNVGAWSGPTAIDDSNTDITALVPYRDGVLICKENGIWALDIQGIPRRVDPGNIFENLRDPNNFRNAINWNGNVLLPLGSGGMYELSEDGALRDISLSLVAPAVTTLDGKVLALAADVDMVFALVEDGSSGELLGAEYTIVNGKLDYHWHHIQRMTISTTAIDLYRQFMLAYKGLNATDVYRRIFISRSGTETSTTSGNEFLPRVTDRDDAYDATSNPIFDTVDIDFGYPALLKELQEITLISADLGSAANQNTIIAQSSRDGGAFANINATSSTFNTSAAQSISFDNATTARRVRLRFNLLKGSAVATSPQILQFTIKAQVRQTPVKIHVLPLIIGDGIPNLAGAREHRSGAKLSQLRTWNAQAASITLTTEDTVAAGVRVVSVPGSMVEGDSYHGWGRRPYQVVTMTFQEVR